MTEAPIAFFMNLLLLVLTISFDYGDIATTTYFVSLFLFIDYNIQIGVTLWHNNY